MIKLLMVLALAIPLTAQEAKSKKEVEKETVPQKVVRHIQDADFRKFEAAHRRAHSKRGEQYSAKESMGDKRQKMHKKQQIKNVVRMAVIGGVAYYIGYHQGQHNKHGMKRKPYMGDRK